MVTALRLPLCTGPRAACRVLDKHHTFLCCRPTKACPWHALRTVCSQEVRRQRPRLPSSGVAPHSDLRYLMRSCPCFFRCICDETFAVHFFFSIHFRLEDFLVRAPTSGSARWCLWILVTHSAGALHVFSPSFP